MSLRCLDLLTDSGMLHVRLRNPPVHLLDAALSRELNVRAETLVADATGEVVIFGIADPDFFLCHSDEREMLALPVPVPAPLPDTPPAMPGPFDRIIERLRTLPQITVVQVDGIARGAGLEFHLSLDRRFASRRSRLALPEVAAGLIPDGRDVAATAATSRLVEGPANARSCGGCGRQHDRAMAPGRSGLRGRVRRRRCRRPGAADIRLPRSGAACAQAVGRRVCARANGLPGDGRIGFPASAGVRRGTSAGGGASRPRCRGSRTATR